MIDPQTKQLLEIYKQKRFTLIEGIPKEKMLKVDSEEVTKVIKKNYSYLTCTCESSGKTGHNSICRHKKFFILFPVLEELNSELDKLIKNYTSFNRIKKDSQINDFIDRIKDIKRLL